MKTQKTAGQLIIIIILAFAIMLSGCGPQSVFEQNATGHDFSTLHATVVDQATNEAIPNAIVYLGAHPSDTSRCKTDANGICSIRDFGWGDYGLSAYMKGYARYAQSAHFEKGSNEVIIKLEKKSEALSPLTIQGDVIEIIVAEGTRSENHYLKLRSDTGEEYYLFNDIGENYGFEGFINKRVQVKGYLEQGTAGWQAQGFEGIYVEAISKI